MADVELDAISEELLLEFEKLGKDYPYLTKMFMDMVTIVAQHNAQITSISGAMQDIVSEVTRIRDVLKGPDWRTSLYDEGPDLSEFGEIDQVTLERFFTRFRPPKKDELN